MDISIVDLFEHQELLPDNLRQILEYYDTAYGEDIGYEELKAMQIAVESVGYTFDWGLDAIPYNLRTL